MIKDLEEVALNCHLFEETVAQLLLNSEVMHEFFIAHLRIGEVITCKGSIQMQFPGSCPIGG